MIVLKIAKKKKKCLHIKAPKATYKTGGSRECFGEQNFGGTRNVKLLTGLLRPCPSSLRLCKVHGFSVVLKYKMCKCENWEKI